MLAQVILKFLQGASLQYMWDMINAQQIVIILPLFDESQLKIPTNAETIFDFIMSIAAFEAIPTDDIYAKVSSVEPEALSSRFETVGLEHFLLLNNFGTLGFVIAMMPFLYAGHWLIISRLRGIKCCRKWDRKLDK